MNRKTIEQLSNEKRVYELKVGNVNVEMNYSKASKKMDECMLNILEKRIK